MRFLLYLGADDLLREVSHGVGQPALQAFGKVTDGLSESAWRSFEVCLVGEKRTEAGLKQYMWKQVTQIVHFLFVFSGGCHVRTVGLDYTSM